MGAEEEVLGKFKQNWGGDGRTYANDVRFNDAIMEKLSRGEKIALSDISGKGKKKKGQGQKLVNEPEISFGSLINRNQGNLNQAYGQHAQSSMPTKLSDIMPSSHDDSKTISKSPYSFGNLMNKDTNKTITKDKDGNVQENQTKVKMKINPLFFIGLAVFIGVIFAPTYSPIKFPQIVWSLLQGLGLALILFGVFASAFQSTNIKQKWYSWVNKMRIKKGKSIKCIYCGKDNNLEVCDNPEGEGQVLFCKKCRQITDQNQFV